jgi:hypothetical protein
MNLFDDNLSLPLFTPLTSRLPRNTSTFFDVKCFDLIANLSSFSLRKESFDFPPLRQVSLR